MLPGDGIALKNHPAKGTAFIRQLAVTIEYTAVSVLVFYAAL